MSGEGILPNDPRGRVAIGLARGDPHCPEQADAGQCDAAVPVGVADYLFPLMENPDVND